MVLGGVSNEKFASDLVEDEDILALYGFTSALRHAAARACVEAEESVAVESTRPTVAVFPIAPWR